VIYSRNTVLSTLDFKKSVSRTIIHVQNYGRLKMTHLKPNDPDSTMALGS